MRNPPSLFSGPLYPFFGRPAECLFAQCHRVNGAGQHSPPRPGCPGSRPHATPHGRGRPGLTYLDFLTLTWILLSYRSCTRLTFHFQARDQLSLGRVVSKYHKISGPRDAQRPQVGSTTTNEGETSITHSRTLGQQYSCTYRTRLALATHWEMAALVAIALLLGWLLQTSNLLGHKEAQ